jgi:hypothetical protein
MLKKSFFAIAALLGSSVEACMAAWQEQHFCVKSTHLDKIKYNADFG